MRKIEIAPSVLAADFGHLQAEVDSVAPYIDRIHFDVMDGRFVNNISFGAVVLKGIKTELPVDAHLMIEAPWKYYEDFAAEGATTIIPHIEALDEPRKRLEALKEMGILPGVSIKPGTDVNRLKDYLDLLDQVLVMTVEPGWGGQSFMEDMMPKIGQLRELGFEGNIAVDGGIKPETAPIAIEAGANILIAGSAIFKYPIEERPEIINELRNGA